MKPQTREQIWRARYDRDQAERKTERAWRDHRSMRQMRAFVMSQKGTR